MTKLVYINNGSHCRIRRIAEDIYLITKIIIASKPLYSREAFKSPVTNSISNNDIMGKAIVAYSISYMLVTVIGLSRSIAEHFLGRALGFRCRSCLPLALTDVKIKKFEPNFIFLTINNFCESFLSVYMIMYVLRYSNSEKYKYNFQLF